MKLKIAHLSFGLHEFDFEEKIESFEVEGPERFPNTIFVHIHVDKESSNMVITLTVRTKARFVCDRCLDEFDQEIQETSQLLYSREQPAVEYSEYFREYDDEVRPYSPEMDILDLTKDVRDTLLLAVPMKLLCKEDCKGLCPVCGANLNHETCSCKVETVDPRWEGLKKLLQDS